MNGKVIGGLVCFLLMSTFLTVAEEADYKQMSKESAMCTFYDDVPIWNVGDSWTYTIDDFTVDYEEGGQKIFVDGRIDDFRWTVSDTSGGDYRVDFTGKLNADYEIYLTSQSMTLYVKGTFKNILTRLTGTIIFTKSDLEIRDVSGEIKGITAAKINRIPIPLPIPFKVTMDSCLSTVFPLLDFPLYKHKFWDFPNMTVSMRINVGGIFGFIKIPVTISRELPRISSPFAFHCKSKQDITVEAGTYNAYKISLGLFSGLMEYYYAPSVGNLIKISANMQNGAIHGELKSTNYE